MIIQKIIEKVIAAIVVLCAIAGFLTTVHLRKDIDLATAFALFYSPVLFRQKYDLYTDRKRS